MLYEVITMIIKFCSCQYQDCQKYRELSDRLGQQEPTMPLAASVPQIKPGWDSTKVPVLGLFCYAITITCYALDQLPIMEFNLHP